LFDIDALGMAAETNLDGATGEVRRANGIVEAELARFTKWWNSSDTMELAIAMRRRAEALRRIEVAHTLRLLGEDEESELAAGWMP
jgi:glutamyl-tRNA reductase